MKKDYIKGLIFRYFLLVISAFPNLFIFYFIFSPLTLYAVYFSLKIFFDISLQNGVMYFQGYTIELIDACIAGSAYYLLLMLNLSTPGIAIKKRIILSIISFLAFLVLNISRIFLLSLMLFSGSNFFDITHKVFWYSISTILVVLIWFTSVKLLKIKGIPFYSDLRYLFKKTRR